MPRVSPSHLAARKQGILKAAARCLARNGLQGTGMRDVFRAANLSPGAVYSYFPGKESLILAIAEQAGSAAEAFADALERAASPSAAALRRALAAAIDSGGERLELELRVASLHSPELAAALERRRQRAEGRLVSLLGSTARAGLALALCDGLAQARALDRGADLEAQIELAARLLGAPADGEHVAS